MRDLRLVGQGGGGGAVKRLLAVVPWDARGPGWANRGLNAYIEETDPLGSLVRVHEKTVYFDDLTPEQQLAWEVGMLARPALERVFGGQQGKYLDEVGP